MFQLLFMTLKYYPKVREKHRCPFSIFKIILTQPFYEFRFLNNFQLPDINQYEKRGKYNKQRRRPEQYAQTKEQRKYAG